MEKLITINFGDRYGWVINFVDSDGTIEATFSGSYETLLKKLIAGFENDKNSSIHYSLRKIE